MLFCFCRLGLLSIFFCAAFCKETLNGRYTKSVENYAFSVPHKLSYHGHFDTFKIPQFYEYKLKSFEERRKKRNLNNKESVHYGIQLKDKFYHLELWPNTNFISPSLIFESLRPNKPLNKRKIRNLEGQKLCHYKGIVRGFPESSVVLSTCDGLTGTIRLNHLDLFFIEPIENHIANSHGQHLHVIYKRRIKNKKGIREAEPVCGTKQGWEDGVRMRFMEKIKKGEEIKFSKRSLSSVERFLEILIVCDRKFVQHYQTLGLDTYVLTVMSMANELYHDASSGNLMELSLVRIIYFDKKEDEIDMQLTLESMKTLKNFCKYTSAINPSKDSPHHHDIAVLLTRMDLCEKEGVECGMTGLAFMSGACTDDKNCAIVEDQGLLVGVTIAHEIGHLIGCFHDSPKHGCEGIDKFDNTSFVMNPTILLNTLRWSPCSRASMNVFFEADLGECLNDIPESTEYPIPTTLPGVVYDKDQQCKFYFGNMSVFCEKNFNKLCEHLFCKKETNDNNCIMINPPALDGTKCGENKWCFKGNCTEMGYRGPEAIHGGWSEWNSWSKCSRTCGGGASSQSRECNNPRPANKGGYCVGERKRYKICNTIECPESSLNFRDFLCQQIEELLDGVKYNWTGFKDAENPCAFNCVDLEKKKVYKFGKYIQDGARCKLGTKNTCINGVCRKVGCDWELNSNAVNDICGICNGDGTKCKIVSKVWNRKAKQGINIMTRIPKGSINLKIESLEPTVCFPIVSSSDSKNRKYYLNNPSIGSSYKNSEYDFGGVRGIYRQIAHNKEQIFIHKALPEALEIFIYCLNKTEEGTTLSFQYSYSTPTNDSTYIAQYLWELAEYEECSVRCGGGIKKAIFDCIELKAGKVSGNYCDGIDKPEAEVVECNKQPCPIRWKLSKWGACKACKNKSGMRFRSVVCAKMNPVPGADDIIEDDFKCVEPKPGTTELCQSEKKCSKRELDNAKIPLDERFLKDIWQQINRKTINPYLEKYESNICKAPKVSKMVKKDIENFDEFPFPPGLDRLTVKVCNNLFLTITEPTCKPRSKLYNSKKIINTSKKSKNAGENKHDIKANDSEDNNKYVKIKKPADTIEDKLKNKKVTDVSVKDMKELVGSVIMDANPEKELNETLINETKNTQVLINLSDEAQENLVDSDVISEQKNKEKSIKKADESKLFENSNVDSNKPSRTN